MRLAAVIRIFDDKNRILLLKRNDKNRTGWCLPGGKVDHEETFIQCAIRELHEETGLLISEPHLIEIGSYNSIIKGEPGRVVVYEYGPLIRDIQDIKLSSEHCGFGWFEEKEIKKSMLNGRTQMALNLGKA